MTNDICLVMQERNSARRTWRRRKNNYNYDRFKALRNKAQNLIRIAKRDYYLNIFNSSDSASVVWNKLRHLGLIKTINHSVNLSHSIDELNEFFTGGAVTREPDDCRPSSEDLLTGHYSDTSFHWKYVAPVTIGKMITSAASNAVGSDGLSLGFVKLIMHSILPVLEHLFNNSLMNGVFPAIWKLALICPIPKIKNPTMMQHYRPISILPVLSKALERVACEQIRGYLEDSAFFDPCQSAYR